ncbi:YqaJ viral recombinase family protein [Phreatobacter sp.]|uniref:YqaJ viral recombinase family protein n=1 Tax=Phreatobacter sp. TaxID=1966341 RepID=UPI003F72D692
MDAMHHTPEFSHFTQNINSDAARRAFIGGSDAKIIMGTDETALIRLWEFKSGKRPSDDYSNNLVVALGNATEPLNLEWYQKNTGHQVTDSQQRMFHSDYDFIAATLDGLTDNGQSVFEAKFMLPWSFSEEAAAAKHMPQLQHNMEVAGRHSARLSILTGGGKWVLITAEADPIYQAAMVEAELRFWDCVQSGRPPRLLGAAPPPPKAEIIRIVNMNTSNEWAVLAATFRSTKRYYDDHLAAKEGLKALIPADAAEAIGKGLRAKRSKTGAVSFEILADR